MMHHPHSHPQHPHHGHAMHGAGVGHPLGPHQVPQNQMHRDQNRMNPQRMNSHAHALQHRGPNHNHQPHQPLLMGMGPHHHSHSHAPPHNMPPPNGVLVSMNTGPAPVVSAHPQVSVGASIPAVAPLSQSNIHTTIENIDGVLNTIEAVVASSNVRPENTTINTHAQSLANTKEKTPMCLVNELARYNKIQHQYRLTSEQGPAHKKRFTVTLKLGDEEYSAEGASIKKAQHSAADDALTKTQYKHPPPKSNRSIRIGSKIGHSGNITPTVELNALAMKRGEPAIYLLESLQNNISNANQNQTQYLPPQMQQNQQHPTANYNNYHRGNNVYQQNRFNNYDRRGMLRNYNQDNQRYWKYPSYVNPGETYTITLKVGLREFTGEGNTPQSARHDAAAKALQELKQLPMPEEGVCPVIDNTTILVEEDPNSELKSPISLVHEIALKRNLAVQFEVLSEKGPPHMKVFVTLCQVGDIKTEGEGNGKKVSKKRAAEKMLDELRKLGPTSPIHTTVAAAARLKRKPTATKKKSRNLIKEKNFTEPDFSEEINPISRLIQIQQAKKAKEPVYNLVEERGASRRREFVMEVTAGGQSATGTGPNKKQAKREAAENLLELMGISREPSSSDTVHRNTAIPVIKPTVDSNDVILEKPRKVTFQENERAPTPTQSTGGSAGRQLVPGLLLMQDQNATTAYKAPLVPNANIQTTATIAKEFLNAGNSPTADALAKSGHSQKIVGAQNEPPTCTLSSTPVIRPKDQLMYLAQLLDFQVQFSDFPKANHHEFLSLVSLTTDPPQVCHGAGVSTEASHDQAATTALQMLSKMGLDNVTPNKKDSGMHSGPGGDGIHVGKGLKLPKAGILSNGLKK